MYFINPSIIKTLTVVIESHIYGHFVLPFYMTKEYGNIIGTLPDLPTQGGSKYTTLSGVFHYHNSPSPRSSTNPLPLFREYLPQSQEYCLWGLSRE